MKQGELFKDITPRTSGEALERGVSDRPEDKFEIRFTVDKVIFIALAGLILLIVIFTLGVEHGRKLQRELFQNQRDIESISNLARVTAVKKSIESLNQREREASGKLLDKELSAIEGTTAPATLTAPPTVPKPAKSSFSLMRLFFGNHPKKSPAPSKPVPVPKETPAALSAPEQAPPPQTADLPVAPVESEPSNAPAALPATNVLTKGYEVRVLSVSQEKYATAEIEQLAKKGFQAAARKSGNYYLVTLGPFALYPEAEAALAKAKNAGGFKDAYIRKLS